MLTTVYINSDRAVAGRWIKKDATADQILCDSAPREAVAVLFCVLMTKPEGMEASRALEECEPMEPDTYAVASWRDAEINAAR
ncbi:MAG TPA: hypothetical protein VK365_03770, partial [Nocardioidaceae bacterium]|nr:hypothetical protein [Nocardioidaceae bacterium]